MLNMPNIFYRAFRKINQLFFWIIHKKSFHFLSKSALFNSPFRIDGSAGISVNDGTSFQRGVWLYCCGIDNLEANLSIGRGSVFGYNNHIACVRSVTIGDFVLTANNVYISDNIHEYEDITKPIIDQPIKFKRALEIGDGSWIGENVSIIGASVGRNSVIGANSVVTHDIPDYSVAVGAPAKVIKRFDLNLHKWVESQIS
jgi:acetyltransferase-like isoleucine patch superfamily enzyme